MAGMPDSGTWRSLLLRATPRRGPGRLGTSFESQTTTAGSGYESPPAGTSQRYGLTHFHPGQIRNAYRKHNQADISPVRTLVAARGPAPISPARHNR